MIDKDRGEERRGKRLAKIEERRGEERKGKERD